jgi:hypothetical protein
MSLYDEVSDVIDALKPFEKITVKTLAERVSREVGPVFNTELNRFIANNANHIKIDEDGSLQRSRFCLDDLENFLDSLRHAKLTVRGDDLITNLVVHINEEKTFSIIVPDDQAADLSNGIISNMLANFGSTLEL